MNNILNSNKIVVNPESLTVTYNGEIVDLRPKEYSILLLLLSYPNRVFTYTDLIDSLWSVDKIPTESSIRSHIKALRKAFRKAGATQTII
jgi:DNA-binding response OmpR family regulator